MSSSDVHFDVIVNAISKLSELIKKFADMLKAFVASFKKILKAADPDYTYATPGDA